MKNASKPKRSKSQLDAMMKLIGAKPMPYKRPFTSEEQNKLDLLSIDKTPQGRKLYKNYLKEIEAIK